MDNRIFKKPIKRNIFSLRKRYSHHKTFGASPVVNLPSKSWLTRLLVQVGNTCTAYTSVAVKEAVTPNVQFDPVKQWDAELQTNGGAAPDGVTADVMMTTGVKTGFFREGSPIPSDNEPAWFTITPTWSVDLFDQMKAALQTTPLCVSLDWYSDWDNALGPVPHTFGNLLGGHETKAYAVDTATFNGVECIMLQGSWGPQYGMNGCFAFDRYMVNKCFSDVRYWANVPTADIVRLGLIQALLVQVVSLYQQLIAQKEGYPPLSKIEIWANAIAKAENAKPSLNNPGDLKLTTLTASWGATKGFQATDGGWIAQFSTYEQGYIALCNFLRLGCENELLAFHSPEARTLEGFMRIFAGNPRPEYYSTIYAETGWGPSTDISTLLS